MSGPIWHFPQKLILKEVLPSISPPCPGEELIPTVGGHSTWCWHLKVRVQADRFEKTEVTVS